MKEFKIRKIDEKETHFTVEIEFADDGERRRFTYPYGEGWDLELNGYPKFVHDMCKRVQEMENMQKLKPVNLKKIEGDIFKEQPKNISTIKPSGGIIPIPGSPQFNPDGSLKKSEEKKNVE